MDLSAGKIRQLVESYGHTMVEFEEYAGGKPLPVLSLKDECFSLIDRLDENRLRAVHALLTGFAS